MQENRDIELKRLGLHIRQMRLSKKMTQEELAQNCNCKRIYISMIERGLRNPSYLSLLTIAKGLSVDPSLLLEV